jgi:hypothetical protein
MSELSGQFVSDVQRLTIYISELSCVLVLRHSTSNNIDVRTKRTLNVGTQVDSLVLTSILLDVECVSTSTQLSSDIYIVRR